MRNVLRPLSSTITNAASPKARGVESARPSPISPQGGRRRRRACTPGELRPLRTRPGRSSSRRCRTRRLCVGDVAELAAAAGGFAALDGRSVQACVAGVAGVEELAGIRRRHRPHPKRRRCRRTDRCRPRAGTPRCCSPAGADRRSAGTASARRCSSWSRRSPGHTGGPRGRRSTSRRTGPMFVSGST